MAYIAPKADVVNFEVVPVILASWDFDLLPELPIPPSLDFYD